MNNRKVKRLLVVLFGAFFLIGAVVIVYMFNMPHRDIQSQNVDYYVTASELVEEFITDETSANRKYLAADGESKIVAVTGTVANISTDLNNQKVILLKSGNDPAGVSATFTQSSNKHTKNIKPGEQITIKGVVRSGASYDSDFEFFEDVIVEKSDVYIQ